MLVDKHGYLYITLLAFALLAYGCANIVPPDGGVSIRKDVSPPEILGHQPEFASTNFDERKVYIEFDEFVVVEDVFNQVLVSPPISKPIEVSPKKKGVLVQLPSDLRPNTTYTINFGEAIKDYREKNILQNFTYVFSTGPELDSGVVIGSVHDHNGDLSKEKVVIGLYKTDSLGAVKHEKPYYFAFVGEDGSFKISYIAPGKYYAYAFTDANFNYRYDLKGNERIGFLNDSIIVTDSTVQNLTIDLFLETGKPALLETRQVAAGQTKFIFNQAISTLLIESDRFSKGDFIEYNAGKDTFTYWSEIVDTGKISFDLTINGKYIDSALINQTMKLGKFVKISNLVGEDSLRLSQSNLIELQFNNPIDSFSTEGIALFDSDSNEIEFSAYLMSRTKLAIEWKDEVMPVDLFIPGRRVFSIYGHFNRKKKISIYELKESLKGSVNILYDYKVGPNPHLLELVNDKDVVVRSVQLNRVGAGDVKIKNIPLGSYTARVFIDVNGDGIWTSGDFDKKIQPEPYVFQNSEVTIRGNWETEIKFEF